jgi:GNAT superfamily N-acetyltransferase
MTHDLLANIVWNSLAGPHARFAVGTERARRYAPGFSPIIGFADAAQPEFALLDPYCAVGEHFYCGGWSGTVPAGWQIDVDGVGQQMVWAGESPPVDRDLNATRLSAEHVPQMLALVDATQPGPFAQRTPELGEYYGVFEGDRLIAMAGERMQAGALREISGVCTHPEFQGRGLARRLVELLIRLQVARQQTPFLHVMRDNHAARRVYARLGFRDRQEMAIRVVSRTS